MQQTKQPRTVLVRACQHLWLILANGVHDDSLPLTLPRSPPPNRDALSEFPRRLATTAGAAVGEDPVSGQLHTAPSPAPHVPVGYLRWNADSLYAFALER